MKSIYSLSIAWFICAAVQAQTFTRTELPTELFIPWEITYGPDDFLWLTEAEGRVLRVDPTSGEKTVVYTAPDYYPGSAMEDSPLCPELSIGRGTLGLTLHPDFMDPAHSFIYFVYSYNAGTEETPNTKFRIKRLTWEASSQAVVADSNIVNGIMNGYDHFGGRLLAATQNGIPYLFYSVGDLGRSEENSPECYAPQSNNPNNFTQDVDTQNGKIHRFHMDGTIPTDNPIAGNSYYTRGHRNPQGLAYNSNLSQVYAIEHGNRTDDEVNILQKGMNYGWKEVRGFHNDESFPGEADFVSNYIPNPAVPGDALIEPFYAWCTSEATASSWTEWCTVAPSDGIYYGSEGIPEWTNSLLVVTLKDGATTDREVYQLKLEANGELAASTEDSPNPVKFFGEDQVLNGRLRDIAISNDGQKVFLINNGGGVDDKITVYTYIPQEDTTTVTSVHSIGAEQLDIELFPNPVVNQLTLKGLEKYPEFKTIQITSVIGNTQPLWLDQNQTADISFLEEGIYIIQLLADDRVYAMKFIKN